MEWNNITTDGDGNGNAASQDVVSVALTTAIQMAIGNDTITSSSMSTSTTSHPLLPLSLQDHINLTAFISAHHHRWNLTSPYQYPFFFFSPNDSFLFPPCPSIQMPMGNLISMVLYTIVCIVGLLGNTLVIYVVLRFSKMQTVTNIYILNLAIADESFLIGIPFLLTTMHLGEWTFGSTMCKAYMVSTSITQFTSSIFLFIMSADRYLAVCHPITSARWRVSSNAKIVSAIAWTTSALIMLPVMLYSNTITYAVDRSATKMSCIIVWPQEEGVRSPITFTLYSLILGFAIPLTLILGFYYLVIKKLSNVGPKSKSKEKRRSHRKVTKLVLTVITAYVLCWLPYWISQVALINSPPDICKTRLEITIFVLAGCLGYSNSAMNPILYAFLSDNFKKSFLKACMCGTQIDINGQLQVENSFLSKFGRNRGSDKNCSNNKAGKTAKFIAITEPAVVGPINEDGSPPTLPHNVTATNTYTIQLLTTKTDASTAKPPVLHTDL